MKVYVASHCRWAGLHVARVLKDAGHEVTSRWLQEDFLPTDQVTPADRARIAQEDADDVAAADVLVLVAGRHKYPGGKFVEAGIAFGLGKRVIVIGHRENMLMHLPTIEQCNTPVECIGLLNAASPREDSLVNAQ